MTPEELKDIKDGAHRWHAVSAELALKLVAEIERLQNELAEVQRGNLIQRMYNAGHL